MANPSEMPLPVVAHHELLRRVGMGACGEVWLARSDLGTYRAAKIIRRAHFEADRPFERELEGVRKFEPVSRTHPGLVAILHVGLEASRASFHYIMEVADDVQHGIRIDPTQYRPRTLSSELRVRGRLPIQDCLRIGMALSDALDHMHRCGLIHRDIKPSNIIFVNGVPKLADIGLVTLIGERVSNVGTMGFIPSEGPGSPTADVFSLGKVLYQMLTGKAEAAFPELPTSLEDTSPPRLMKLNRIILKACDDNPRLRYQSAAELRSALASVARPEDAVRRILTSVGTKGGRETSTTVPIPVPDRSRALKVCLLHKANAREGEAPGVLTPIEMRPTAEQAGGPAGRQASEPVGTSSGLPAFSPAGLRSRSLTLPADSHVLQLLRSELSKRGCEVFLDKELASGLEWARQIENRIRDANAVIVLLSSASVSSEMLACEVEIAQQAGQEKPGQPLLLPVRVRYSEALPAPIGPILNPLPCHRWDSPADDPRLVADLLRALETSWPPPLGEGERSRSEAPGAGEQGGEGAGENSLLPPLTPAERSEPRSTVNLEAIGGAVPLNSEFYVSRPADHEFESAILRGDSIVLLKGARQMGKTSLLARGVQQARRIGARVVLTDLQKCNASQLATVEAFYLTLGYSLADQLNLTVMPEEAWDKRRSPNTNFERYLRRGVLGALSGNLVWVLDEVDRLFTCSFGSEVFGLFRAWHNERALDPGGPWARLTLAMAYATEAHLFITDVNQSPFNVGTRLALDDFTLEQVADLNQRHGSPLQSRETLERFHQLVGGQPYLVRRGLNELARGGLAFARFTAEADRDEGIFGDHLRRMLVLLAKDPALTETVRGVLNGESHPGTTGFYRLRSAGVLKGEAPTMAEPRCVIYSTYFKRHLL